MVISIKKWMEKLHFSPHFQTQMDQAEIGAVGPTAEHLSRHCAHRLSKVMPTDVFLNPPYSILSHPNHSPICQVFQHSFICWCAEACWTHELLRSARTTAMRTPSRFYKAPEKKADVAIDFPKWWEYKKRNIKNCQKKPIPSPNITSPSIIFGVFQSFPVIFPAFYQLHLFRWVELHPGLVQRHRWDSGGVRRGSLAIPMGKMESHLVICWFNHTMKKEGSN